MHISRDGTLTIAGTDLLGHGPGVAASHIREDMMLPLAGIAGFGGVRNTKKYRDAASLITAHRGSIHRLVGHSLGASVSKALGQDFGLPYIAIANPGMTWQGTHGSSRRHRFDPISVFDRGATETPAPGWNPHSYED